MAISLYLYIEQWLNWDAELVMVERARGGWDHLCTTCVECNSGDKSLEIVDGRIRAVLMFDRSISAVSVWFAGILVGL